MVLVVLTGAIALVAALLTGYPGWILAAVVAAGVGGWLVREPVHAAEQPVRAD